MDYLYINNLRTGKRGHAALPIANTSSCFSVIEEYDGSTHDGYHLYKGIVGETGVHVKCVSLEVYTQFKKLLSSVCANERQIYSLSKITASKHA